MYSKTLDHMFSTVKVILMALATCSKVQSVDLAFRTLFAKYMGFIWISLQKCDLSHI